VIFYDITGFQRRGFLDIISINRRLRPTWKLARYIAQSFYGIEALLI
jgi:hypothetical protein